ncbi:hypothetical protein IFM89_005768 [Coptis chinensis]|uniref:Uncharacterized protein n=1 Tax=Coptis chinensis TaxID=261450 RepID=A0A835IL56_9MAGN|nr:hypothetical protein IFM89_005768 [Coptis chinensis]
MLLLNFGLGNEEEQEKIKNFYILRLLNHLMNLVGHVTSAVNWLHHNKYDGIRLKHLKGFVDSNWTTFMGSRRQCPQLNGIIEETTSVQ